MESKFKFLAVLIIAALVTGCGAGSNPVEWHDSGRSASHVEHVAQVVPTVSLTFDYYGSVFQSAYPMLKARGLVGTVFVDPETIDKGQATTEQLNEMRANGWEIQAYSGVNMADLLATNGPNAALARMNSIKAAMASKGFPVTSIAPAGRAWNAQLRGLAEGVFTSVRANTDTTSWQTYPVSDPLYVIKGATASLSSDDTPASLIAQLDSLELARGLWVVVVHKVGDDADPTYSISAATMAAFLDRLAADAAAGKVRVVTFNASLSPAFQ